ncbi:MAG: hypothetical protein Fur0046_22800 [Cyanobacteria bacterium J069]|nr:MAG: hypothetical protein D6742_02170 [Cyanobacteria bacterium J069]
MIPGEITPFLKAMFGEAIQAAEPESWQVELGSLRLLVLLSEDQTWLRSLISIDSAQAAEPYLAQLLEANFDETQEVRYALHQGVLWGVYQHALSSLTPEDFRAAIARLVSLQERGLATSFDRLAEAQIRQIIQAAKQQGQSLEATLQTLERFYAEGMMGGLESGSAEREQALGAWRYQLERLWEEE